MEFRVHYRPPGSCRTLSVIVDADTREEAEYVAAIQYEFPSGTKVIEANPYNVHGLVRTEPKLDLYSEVRRRINDGYYDEWPLTLDERSRRRRQFSNEVAAIFGTRKGHDHLFETAERLARQFRLTGKTTIAGHIVDQHARLNLLDWYQQLKLVADHVAAAPVHGDPMEVVRPIDNRVGARIRRQARRDAAAKALFNAMPHRLLDREGRPVAPDWAMQPEAIKDVFRRKVQATHGH